LNGGTKLFAFVLMSLAVEEAMARLEQFDDE